MESSGNLDNIKGPKTIRIDVSDFSECKDSIIWNEFVCGNHKALSYIYNTYVQKLFTYGCQFAEPELVKDCIQELFAELIRNKQNLGTTDSIKFYLFRCLRRKVYRWHCNIKSRLLRNTIFYNIHFSDEPSVESNWITENLQESQKKCLQKAISTLPLKQREAIMLFYYEGLTYLQIAEIMHLSNVKAARVLIYRSLSNLEKALKNDQIVLLG